mmetsp:Transcript_33511/g.39031  ORF Transcript_33511/g.39031 Transcript_33511/m.39031 type:complete len:602 (+) Transcript_33511:551-2356(+)
MIKNGVSLSSINFVLDCSPPPCSFCFTMIKVGDVFEYTVDGQVNTSGTMLLTIMFAMIVTSMPLVRRIVFEVFYYFHIGFAMAMVFCAFYHSGIFVVILASILWGGDLFIRRVIMTCRYPRKATIKRLTDTVIEVSIPKTKNLDYNCGQYMFIAVPELSVFQWHPISISSSPYQNDLTFHIRKTGSARSWTSGLYNLAEKRKEISVWLEGPYGSLGVDLTGDRYKMVMFLSGGIGVTPMQSVCNQMMYEHEWGERRGLKKIWFIWTARDPKIMENMEITRHSIKPLFFPPLGDDAGTLETMNATSEESMNATPETMTFGGAVFDSKKGFTASSCTKASLLSYMLLTEMPFSQTSDDELERQFPLDDFLEEDNNFKELEKAEDDQNQSDIESFRTTLTADRFFARNHIVPSFIYNTIHGIFAQNVSTAPNKKVIKNEDLENTKTSTGDKLVHDIKEEEEIAEYNDIEVPKMSSPGGQVHDEKPQQKPDHEDTFNHTLCSYATGPKKHILQLDCYLTTKEIQEAGLTSMIPFAHRGRPDFKQIFLDMRKEAIKQGENRVAVCVCAPYRIVQICKMACIKYSNKQVRFDCHTEAFGGKAFGGNS